MPSQHQPDGRPAGVYETIPERHRHHQHAAVAILDIGRRDDGAHRQTLRIDEDVPLLAFDLLPAIEARRINPTPLFPGS